MCAARRLAGGARACVDAVGVDGKRRILSNKLRKRGTAVVDVDDVDLGRNRV